MKLSNRKGLSLLEMVIAMALFTLMALPLLGSRLSATAVIHQTFVASDAMNVLTSYIENRKASAYDAVVDAQVTNILVSDNGTDEAEDDILGEMNLDVTDNNDGTKTLSCALTWQERATTGLVQDRSATLTTLIADI